MRKQDFLLVPAVLAVSWSAPLIRLAGDAPAISIAFWRTFIATALLAPFVLTRHRAALATIERRDALAMLVGGAFLAIHFAAWIASVGMTTVASSALLVASQPVFVALASTLIGEAPTRRIWVGIALAISGGLLIAGGDLGADGASVAGDALAVLGAISAAIYFIVGRRVRARLAVLPYVFVVYGTCAVLLAGAMLATGTGFGGYSAITWWIIVAIALGPQLFGHTTFNLLLGRLEPARVALAVMGEPIGSAAIAAWLFGEIPGPLLIPGGALLLAGVVLAMTDRPPKGIPLE